MAKSAYEYVKQFETNSLCPLNCWIVVRVDGKNFHKFADTHGFQKPNDKRSLHLMTNCASQVMDEIKDIIIAYGESDEYSFVFARNTKLYNRRQNKLLTNVCSLFTSAFVFHWKSFFPHTELKYPPSFDGRVVTYPTNRNLRDYLSWRQADCHINNLYNTTFWYLVQSGGFSRKDAEEKIRFTNSAEKNEMLFSLFGVNYNKEEEQFKKGTLILREKINKQQTVANSEEMDRTESGLIKLFTDIIGNKLWDENPHILGTD